MATPELYLIVEVCETSADVLAAALSAAAVASVLLRPAPGHVLEARTLKPLVEQLQKKGVAALVADDSELARTVRADGVHLSWTKDQPQRFGEAREVLGQRYILGADAGRSRDDAMTLGESGADYVAFGIPPHVEDRQSAFERQCELLDWWSEIFEVPCIGLDAATPQQAAALAQSHADFVSATIEAAMSPDAARAHVLAVAAAVSGTAVPA